MRLQLIILISFCLFGGIFCDDDVRTLKATKNPGCDLTPYEDCDTLMILHIEADSSVDRLHYIYDFSAKPAVLIAKSDKNSTLVIDWIEFAKKAHKNSVKIIPEPSYTFSTVMHSFVVFNDTKDTANFSDPSIIDFVRIDPHNLSWTLVALESSEQNVTLEMNAKYFNGSFSIKCTTYGSSAHALELPHLMHSAHSMQIDLVAKNVNYTYKNPRIAFELLVLSDEDKSEGNFALNRIRNLDDEFTPGIFDVYNLVSPRSSNDTKGSFIQYRPVCYISKTRSVSSSTESNHGNLMNVENEDEKYRFSLPYAFYDDLSKKLNQAINITLGIHGDDFYSRTNYISFSYLVGIGNPPLEGLSPFVITFAAIGLGVPLILLLFGGTYVAIKRYSN